jgi:hypothetical protein
VNKGEVTRRRHHQHRQHSVVPDADSKADSVDLRSGGVARPPCSSESATSTANRGARRGEASRRTRHHRYLRRGGRRQRRHRGARELTRGLRRRGLSRLSRFLLDSRTSIDRRHAQAAHADDPTWSRCFLPNANTDGASDGHGDALRVECVHEAPLDAEVGSTGEHADRQTAAQRSEVLADDDLGA